MAPRHRLWSFLLVSSRVVGFGSVLTTGTEHRRLCLLASSSWCKLPRNLLPPRVSYSHCPGNWTSPARMRLVRKFDRVKVCFKLIICGIYMGKLNLTRGTISKRNFVLMYSLPNLYGPLMWIYASKAAVWNNFYFPESTTSTVTTNGIVWIPQYSFSKNVRLWSSSCQGYVFLFT